MSDWSKLEKLANDYVAQIDGDDDDLYQEARDMFEDACDTTTILALIAENNLLNSALTRIAFRCQSFLADERVMQLESIEAIIAICDAALDNSSPENS